MNRSPLFYDGDHMEGIREDNCLKTAMLYVNACFAITYVSI